MKRFSVFIILFSFLLVPKPAEALTQTGKELLFQQIQIIQQEIQLLQSLLFNMQLQREISAASYLAVNLSDNSTLLAKNADKSYPIASITKLMNAVIVSEYLENNQTITLTEKMLEPLGQSPSLFPGLNISAKNLLKASLIQSANDASEALAYFLGKDKFLNLMNQKAKELGMKNTFFSDAHGLSPTNRSTAADLAKLMAYIQEDHPEILQITRDNGFWLPNAAGAMLKFKNVNNFYPLGSFIGGKTGYLIEARQTLASIFQINGEPVAVILLYSDNRQADIFAILKQLSK